MEQPIYRNCRAVPLEGTLQKLARSKKLRQSMAAHFGDVEVIAALAMMRAGRLEGSLSGRVHDFLSDELVNECAVAWNGLIPGSEYDYPVCVHSYAGIFHVWALEYDSVGYFLCLADAKDYVYMNWDEVREKWPARRRPPSRKTPLRKSSSIRSSKS